MTDDLYIITTALNIQIACHTDGIKYGYLILRELETTRVLYLAQYIDKHIGKLYCDHSIVTKILRNQLVLNGMGYFLTVHTRNLYGT